MRKKSCLRKTHAVPSHLDSVTLMSRVFEKRDSVNLITFFQLHPQFYPYFALFTETVILCHS